MPLRSLEYQERVLTCLDAYMAELVGQKAGADRIAELARKEGIEFSPPDFAARTWETLRTGSALPTSRINVPFSPRMDGIHRPVPNIVFKVPTGGGKTYLAVSAPSRIFVRYLARHNGFVLWIVPNEAIYTQTKRQFTERSHPYRQMFDVLSGNRTKILEKQDRLDARDAEDGLCVMLLMLQSANRQTRETLKMFQDRGDVHGFFPPEGEMDVHRRVLEEIPNLDAYDRAGEAGAFWPLIKDSLGNALRVTRPVVVLDEGHRAISELAFETLYGFNPCFVLELTATPKDVAARGGTNPRPARPANVLVEIRGIELDREGMIKMPLNLEPRAGTDWCATLGAAVNRLRTLDGEADRLKAEKDRYIRPILLVQVERTGGDQLGGGHIHAVDVRDQLLRSGFDEAEIAVKTADTNDLAQPENQDLLSSTNRIRVIITKQALQEGWDCPFAYVLCALAASSNPSGMTQLIGRILRQPDAEKTGIAALDECYVITHHADTARVVEGIKTGLESDGLGDLVKQIRVSDQPGTGRVTRQIRRREQFADTQIYLPQVLWVEGKTVRPLDYEQDVLFGVEWNGIDVAPLVATIPTNAQAPEYQMRRIRLVEDGPSLIATETVGSSGEIVRFDPTYAVRMVSDIVLNPWVARQIIGDLLHGLAGRGFDEANLAEISGLIIATSRAWLSAERDRMAESRFRAHVAAGRIQFRLRTDIRNWPMPIVMDTAEPEGADQLLNASGGALQRSLFFPVYRNDFNTDEREIAVYMDGEKALGWWHRNVARAQYSIQGWRREKIYPDFIFAMQRDPIGRGGNRLIVMEMKGDYLAGNLDTTYKQALLRLMSESYSFEHVSRVGELELLTDDGTTVECDLVLMSEWKTRLPNEYFSI
jgi:type III restriction enzyme